MKITKMRKDATLAPRLKEVLDLVYAKRPLLEYEVTEYSDNNYAETVVVWQDGQMIGAIYSRYRRYSPSKETTDIWYGVESHNIKKERGDRNRKFCKDAKVAARTVIEMFTKRTLDELGQRLIQDVKSAIDSMRDRVMYEYRTQINGVSSTILADYFTDLFIGKNPPIPKDIENLILKQDVIRKRENAEIATNILTHCRNNNGYALKMMQDETLLFTHLGNSSTTSKHQSTYELDQYTQEKYAMLKLLDPNQFAADIGVKYERDDGDKKHMIYFIVAGETKVM